MIKADRSRDGNMIVSFSPYLNVRFAQKAKFAPTNQIRVFKPITFERLAGALVQAHADILFKFRF